MVILVGYIFHVVIMMPDTCASIDATRPCLDLSHSGEKKKIGGIRRVKN